MEINILEERELFAIKSAIVIAELQEMQEKTKKLEAILLQYQDQDQIQDEDQIQIQIQIQPQIQYQQPVIKEELDNDNYVPSTDAHMLEPPRKRIKREN
jgi:hypothetical protein